MYGLGGGQVTGVTELCIDKPMTAACERIDGANRRCVTQNAGQIRAAGGTLQCCIQRDEFLEKFDGAVTLNAGALSDASRMYPIRCIGIYSGTGWSGG